MSHQTPSLGEPADSLAEAQSPALLFAAANAYLYAKEARLVWRYLWRNGRLPNIANPKRFTERMLWRKTVDHNPQFVVFSDKLATKEYWRGQCPDLLIPPVRWIGDDTDAIPEEALEGDVFVKASHGCAFNHRIQGGQCDRAALREETRRWLCREYGWKRGEWAYREVERKLFVEETVGDAATNLYEINIRACNGRPLLGSVMGKCNVPGHWAVYLDPEGTAVPGMDDAEGSPIVPLPEGLEILEPYRRAVEHTRKASVGVDYARFDFMWNGRELYAGEITVYPGAGSKNPGNSWINHILMTGWELGQSHFLKSEHSGWKRRYAQALRNLRK